jgi:hypothetical protein
MTRTLTWVDRLRIERAVWALDQRLYDLPHKSRVAKRREVRENLLTAAQDIGTLDALNRLGNSRQLAAEYLSAEFGEGPRPYWVAAATFAVTAQLLFTWVLGEAASAFGDGITAANAHATGTFTWSGIRYLQDTVTYTLVDGKGSSAGGAWTPLSWAIWVVVTVLVGRLWRVASTWRRRHASTTTTGLSRKD